MSPKRPHDGESTLPSSGLAKKAVRMGALLSAVGGAVRADVAHAGALDFVKSPVSVDVQYGTNIQGITGSWYDTWSLAGDPVTAAEGTPLAVAIDTNGDSSAEQIQLSTDGGIDWSDISSDFGSTSMYPSSYDGSRDRLAVSDMKTGNLIASEGYGATGSKTTSTNYPGLQGGWGCIDPSTGKAWGTVSSGTTGVSVPAELTPTGYTKYPIEGYNPANFCYVESQDVAFFNDIDDGNQLVIIEHPFTSSPVINETGTNDLAFNPQLAIDGHGVRFYVGDNTGEMFEYEDPTTIEDTGGTDTGVVDTGVTDTGGSTDTGVEDTGATDTGDTGDTGGTGETADTSDTGTDTGDSAADTGDTGDTSDTGETGDSAVDTEETADSGADTSDTGVVVETGDTGDTGETGDTEDTQDTGIASLPEGCTDVLPDGGTAFDAGSGNVDSDESAVFCDADGRSVSVDGPAYLDVVDGRLTAYMGSGSAVTVDVDGGYVVDIVGYDAGIHATADGWVDAMAGDDVSAIAPPSIECDEDGNQIVPTDTQDSSRRITFVNHEGALNGEGIYNLGEFAVAEGATITVSDTTAECPQEDTGDTGEDTGNDTGSDTGIDDTGDSTVDSGADSGVDSVADTGNTEQPSCGCAVPDGGTPSTGLVLGGVVVAMAASRRRK